jgi:hypothetical protein
VNPKWTWLALAVLAGAALGGGLMVAIDRKRVAKALRDAFDVAGLPPAWGEALGRVESGLKLGATNLAGPDGKRGGAWGPTQITEKTARAYGYEGPMEALTTDLYLAASLSARIASAGSPITIEDLGAWWNAGRRSAEQLPEGHVTRTTYIPRLVAALGDVA